MAPSRADWQSGPLSSAQLGRNKLSARQLIVVSCFALDCAQMSSRSRRHTSERSRRTTGWRSCQAPLSCWPTRGKQYQCIVLLHYIGYSLLRYNIRHCSSSWSSSLLFCFLRSPVCCRRWLLIMLVGKWAQLRLRACLLACRPRQSKQAVSLSGL